MAAEPFEGPPADAGADFVGVFGGRGENDGRSGAGAHDKALLFLGEKKPSAADGIEFVYAQAWTAQRLVPARDGNGIEIQFLLFEISVERLFSKRFAPARVRKDQPAPFEEHGVGERRAKVDAEDARGRTVGARHARMKRTNLFILAVWRLSKFGEYF